MMHSADCSVDITHQQKNKIVKQFKEVLISKLSSTIGLWKYSYRDQLMKSH
jgi:hypothetical protein